MISLYVLEESLIILIIFVVVKMVGLSQKNSWRVFFIYLKKARHFMTIKVTIKIGTVTLPIKAIILFCVSVFFLIETVFYIYQKRKIHN